MSLFKKLFGSGNDASDDKKEKEASPFNPEIKIPVDELFTFNFKKNGGKFLYCENLEEVNEQLLNILEENDWFECEAVCYEPKLFHFLDDNKLTYKNVTSPKFLLASCENLIADEGSVLLTSNQIKQNKPNELPANIVVFATTSQILESKSDGLREIKKRYEKDYPTNITTIKYFEKAKEEDFLHYGSAAKNLYLLLLEDL
ncbi:MAG: LUD domain-containing protein [Flavobacteriales bacterium]|uniref:LUD domain-containing protein n=1 Tax=Flavobacterium TaxID=237 RepID=UPI0004239569|nr:LUD domain-containing protein [Flavobacterium filum]MBN8565481.1 LUD domain-containing protein [Flavobacteriales bacterium]